MKKALVIGSINVDIVCAVDRCPQLGETILALDTSFIPGGKGANQALSLQKMGVDVVLVGKTGCDDFAAIALTELSKHGVDLSRIRQTQEKPTGLAMILVDRKGDNSIVVSSGANGAFSREDISGLESLISASSALVLQLEIPLDRVLEAAQIAKKHGVPVILNTAPAAELPEVLLAAVDILICNETEASILSGVSIHSIEEAKLAASVLHKKIGAGKVIITLGETGTVYAGTSGEINFQPAFKVQAVDTVAAGDAFVGGLVSCIIQGMTLQEAVIWGNACGAVTVTKRGAQISLPEKAEIERFLSSR